MALSRIRYVTIAAALAGTLGAGMLAGCGGDSTGSDDTASGPGNAPAPAQTDSTGGGAAKNKTCGILTPDVAAKILGVEAKLIPSGIPQDGCTYSAATGSFQTIGLILFG